MSTPSESPPVNISIHVPKGAESSVSKEVLLELKSIAAKLEQNVGLQTHMSCQRVFVGECAVFTECHGVSL